VLPMVIVLLSVPPVNRLDVMLAGVTPMTGGVTATPWRSIDFVARSGSFDEIERTPVFIPTVNGLKLMDSSFFCPGESKKLVTEQENSPFVNDNPVMDRLSVPLLLTVNTLVFVVLINVSSKGRVASDTIMLGAPMTVNVAGTSMDGVTGSLDTIEIVFLYTPPSKPSALNLMGT
jgi:hypothetical protein